MFKKSIARKEIAKGWAWMRKQYPAAAEDAKKWVAENKEDMKQVDRILYDSENKYYNHSGFVTPEEAETQQSLDPEDYLPEEVKERIYDDKAWFVRYKYLPKDFDGNADMHLQKEIVEGLHELTELQREVIFRNVVNGEDVSAIAKEKDCSARNIRDIRVRALKALRVAATKGKPGEGYPDAVLFAFWGILVMAAIAILLVPDSAEPWMRAAVFIALPIVTVVSAIVLIHKSWRAGRIRRFLTLFRKK